MTVTGVNGPLTASNSTTVTVKGATPTTTTKKPTTTATTKKPSSPPAAPTGLSGTHSGTTASVGWNKVAGATSYTFYCNDVGEKTITGTSGSVGCGADSAGKPVRVGVKANNAAGSSRVVEVYAK